MSPRIAAFRSYVSRPFLNKGFKKLTASERVLCEAFITDHDHLDKGEFELHVNRWMLDDPAKPKNHSLMWAFVGGANVIAHEGATK